MSLTRTAEGTARGKAPNGRGSERTNDEPRALTRRIVASRHFERSPRLKELFLYLTEYALHNPGTELHEQQIGAEVFGKELGYDTSLDNVVRVTASQLRKRLDLYFGDEGSGETLLVEIPKGQYVPIFRERPLVPVAEPPPTKPPAERRLRWRAPSPLTFLLAVLAIGLGAYAWYLREHSQTEWDSSPALKTFWSQVFHKSQNTDVVLADSTLSLFQDIAGGPLNLQQYLDRESWRNAAALKDRPDLQLAAQLTAQKRYTSFADAIIASRIASLVGGEGKPLVLFARDLNIRQLKNDNVVLIGSSRANPWVELFDPHLSFHFRYDMTAKQSYFENSAPRPGEPAAYRNDQQGASYCLIAFLPNLSRTGNALIISGTEIEGTEAGGEFVTTETSMVGLRKMLGANDRFPYFEILLKTRKIGGSVPEATVVCQRLRQF